MGTPELFGPICLVFLVRLSQIELRRTDCRLYKPRSICLFMLCSSSNSQVRKPKSLPFNNKVSKISDLKCYQLATLIARQTSQMSEQNVMRLGGELYELQRRGLKDMRLSDQSDALSLRLQVTRDMQNAEFRWRKRLLKLLGKGRGGSGLRYVLSMSH